jgi:hypothetical protein
MLSEHPCISLLMGRPLYSLQCYDPLPELAPELQEAVQLRESLSQAFGLIQTVRWSNTVATWWKVSMLTSSSTIYLILILQAHVTEFPHLKHSIVVRMVSLEGASFETLLAHTINLARTPLFGRTSPK